MNNSILLVIPCYRERMRLPAFLTELLAQVETLPFPVTVCPVDDGSGAEHANWLRTFVEGIRPHSPNLRSAILSPTNLGKGGAVYLGWRMTPGTTWLAFADADGATPPREITRVLQEIASAPAPADAYFASRIKMLGRTICRRKLRHVTGRIFATATSTMLNIPVYDSQCGFKVVRRTAFDEVYPKLREQRFCFDVDLLIQLQLAGRAVVEVPVDWEDKDGSKVNIVSDSLSMLYSLFKLRRLIIQSRRNTDGQQR